MRRAYAEAKHSNAIWEINKCILCDQMPMDTYWGDTKTFCIMCSDCKTMSDEYKTRRAAINNWNKANELRAIGE